MGFLIIFYGDGKGKTTAALGCALRALGHGYKVIIAHFIKSSSYECGEFKILKQLPGLIHLILGPGLQAKSNEVKDTTIKGLYKILDLIKIESPFLTILDELGIAIYRSGISIQKIIDIIQEMLNYCHVIITGKYMPRELIEIADLVTEMRNVKHYYSRGFKAVRGLEW